MPGEFAAATRDRQGQAPGHLLPAKDLKLIKPKDHAELSQRATELKRMLTVLLPKLNDC